MSLQFVSFLLGLVITSLSMPFGIVYSIGVGLLINSLMVYTVMVLHDLRIRGAMPSNNKPHKHVKPNTNVKEKTVKAVQVDDNGEQVGDEMSEEENMKVMKGLLLRKYVEHIEDFSLTIAVSKEYYNCDQIHESISSVEEHFQALTNATAILIESIGENLEQEISDEIIEQQINGSNDET